MTCIVGIRTTGGVLIAGDSIGTNRATSEVRLDPKVFAAGPLAFGHTTSFRWGQIVQFYSLPALARGENAPAPRDDPYEWAVTTFIPRVRSDLAEHGWLRKEHEREEGGRALLAVGERLLAIHSDFQVAEAADRYAAVGSGAEVALGALYTRLGGDSAPVSRRLARSAASLALEAAAHHSAQVRLPVLIAWSSPIA